MSVKQELRVALVEVDVAKARRPKETAVRHGARADKERHADKARANRVPGLSDATRQGLSAAAAEWEPSSSAGAAAGRECSAQA